MRVLFLANAGHIGGGNRSLLTIAEELSRREHDVAVVIPEAGPMQDACQAVALPCRLQYYQQPSWSAPIPTWKGYRSWKRLLGEFRPDIIHANDLIPARSVALAAHNTKIPVICHVRYPPDPKQVAWTFRLLPKPQVFLFNSKALQNEVGPHVKSSCPKAKQGVLYNALSLDQFQPEKKDPYPKRVGIVANLMPVKGHKDFLTMARDLIRRGIDAEFWLIGSDIHNTGYGKELENFTAEIGLNGQAKFLGHCPNVPELINQLDVVVCASHVEPFGRCLIEAMACARPVVATAVGGIPEVVGNSGGAGFLVPPRAPTEMADAVGRLLNDETLCTQMGKVGRQRVLDMFTIENHVARLLEFYHDLKS